MCIIRERAFKGHPRYNLNILYEQRKQSYLSGKANLKDVDLNLGTIKSMVADLQTLRTTDAKVLEAANSAAEILARAEKQGYKSISDFDELKRTKSYYWQQSSGFTGLNGSNNHVLHLNQQHQLEAAAQAQNFEKYKELRDGST